MIDYAFKSEVLKSGLCSTQKQVSKSINCDSPFNKFTKEQARQIDKYYSEYAEAEWQEAFKINHAQYLRHKRLEKRITKMLNQGQCLFVTFTFSDDTLHRTTEDTRRQIIFRLCKSYSDTYVANIDYGEKADREHYHAVILADNIDMDYYREHYGYIYVEKIKNTSDAVKLSKYIAKLTNHAIKATNKRQTLIYSR